MENLNKVLIIIPCGKSKIWDKNPSAGKKPARDVYISSYFKLCRQYAEKFSDGWAILSGKYGIIHPDFIIDENYDMILKANNKFKNKIRKQLKTFISRGFASFISLCGENYSELLEEILNSFNLKLIAPLKGVNIGVRQKMLKESLRDNIPIGFIKQKHS